MKTLHKQKYKCPDCGITYTKEEWSTNDPAKKLPCRCDPCFDKYLDKKYGPSIFSNITKPSWIRNVQINPNKMDADAETRHTEAILEEKRKEIRTSRKARDWEASRKKEIMNYKSTWIKRGRKTKDLPKL